MLSKAALLILGLINQKEINAYELTKVLKKMHINNWFKVANSTVYATIRNLDKGKLIDGYSMKENNMPEKTYYKITPSGKEELINSIKKIISNFSYDPVPFSIAGFFITIINRQEVDSLLKERLNLLIKYKEGLEAQIKLIEKENVSVIYVCNVKRNYMIINNEIDITNIYISEIGKIEKWDIDNLKRMIMRS